MMDYFLGSAELKWEIDCRNADIVQRALEDSWYMVDTRRRLADEKCEQLKAVSELSALLGGFGMVVLVEVKVEDETPDVFVFTFGISAALVVALMMWTMINTTLMHITLLSSYEKYCSERNCDFPVYWNTRFQKAWGNCLGAFFIGAPLFILVLGQLGWLVFRDHDEYYGMASAITAIASVALGLWVFHIARQWKDYLMSSHHGMAAVVHSRQ